MQHLLLFAHNLNGSLVLLLIFGDKYFQDLLKDFLGKRERGELLIQKTQNLLENILRKVLFIH